MWDFQTAGCFCCFFFCCSEKFLKTGFYWLLLASTGFFSLWLRVLRSFYTERRCELTAL